MPLHYNTINKLLKELSVMQRRLKDIEEQTHRDYPKMGLCNGEARKAIQEVKDVLMGEHQ